MIKILTAISLITLVHSWYPPECCSGQDCKPVPCDQLVEMGNGDWKFEDKVFSKEKIRLSEDQYCHVCIHPFSGNPLCAFIVPGA